MAMAEEPQQTEHFTNMGIAAQTGDQLLDPMKATQISTRELINRSMEDLVEEINAKRKRDSTLVTDFKSTMERQCTNTCNSVEAAMYNIYVLTNKSVQDKLQELTAVLERIAKLEVELEDFKTALSALYTDVHSQE